MRKSLLLAILAACTVDSGKSVPPVVGEGAIVVDKDTQKVTLDDGQVPVLASCGPGQVVHRSADGIGWTCAAALDTTLASATVRLSAAETKLASLAAADISDFTAAARNALSGATIDGGVTIQGDLQVNGHVRATGGGNLLVNPDLALGQLGWYDAGAYAGFVSTRTVMSDPGAPVGSGKFWRLQITAAGPSGDVAPFRFPILLKKNADYHVSCFVRTESSNPVKGNIQMEMHDEDWDPSTRTDIDRTMTYAADGAWHRVGGTFNTGALQLAEITLRGFNAIGAWDLTGCQLTEGPEEKPFSVDRTEMPCPNPNSIVRFGLCIFNFAAGNGWSYRAAATTCTTMGMHLCTRAELSMAQAAGAQWCTPGWLADRVDNGTAYRGFPTQSADASCGNIVGVYEETANMNLGAGANCCR